MCISTAEAAMERVAIFDFKNHTELTREDLDYLEDVFLRGEVRDVLPYDLYLLMTKENMISLLEENGIDLDKVCEGQCEVEVGRKIQAHYIVTGTVWRKTGNLEVIVELYKTKNGNLLSQQKVSGPDLSSICAPLKDSVSKLLTPLLRPAPHTSTSQSPIQPSSGESKKPKESFEATSSAPAPSAKAIEEYGFMFEPRECRRRGDDLTCSISFSNVSDETVHLQISAARVGGPNSYITDDLGNQYPVTLQIGDRQSRNWIEENFLPQSPVNVDFTAKNVKPGATHITVVIGMAKFGKGQLMIGAPGQGELVAIKNIPVGK